MKEIEVKLESTFLKNSAEIIQVMQVGAGLGDREVAGQILQLTVDAEVPTEM